MTRVFRLPARHRTWQRGACGAGLLALGLVQGGGALAATPHSRHPEHTERVVYITYREALRRGATGGPDVLVAAAPRSALRDAVESANPVLSQVPFAHAQLGPRFSGSETNADVVVGLTQPLPLMNAGRAQERLARAERKYADDNLQLTALDSAERAGQAWIELARAEQLLSLRKRAVEQAKANLKLVESRTRAGEADATERALAAGDLASAQALVLDAEGLHFQAASTLSYLTGLEHEQRAEVRGRLAEPSAPQQGPAPARAHPAVTAAEAQAQASKEAIDYARSQQTPTLAFGVQYQREGTGDQILTGVLSVPLPVWQPWRFQEARQRAQYDRDRARARMVRDALQRQTEVAHHETSHARARYELLLNTALPPKREMVRLAQAQFKAGAIDFVRVSLAQRELLAAEEQLVAALADVHSAELHLLRCTGALQEQLR